MTDKCAPWHVNCNCEEQARNRPHVVANDVSFANRYHQTLGAKWMVEAIIRECRTKFALNRNVQEFANDLERRWEDEAFWRPCVTPQR